ncbi:MAG: AI-2E family transporter, partial [Alphaproteobacteria bacterium]
LLPFSVSIIVAYILDPVCDKLEEKGCSRSAAVAIVTVIFVLLVSVIVLLVVPPLVIQLYSLIQSIPDIFTSAQQKFAMAVTKISSYLPSAKIFETDEKMVLEGSEVWARVKALLGEDAIGVLSTRLADSAGSIINIVLSLAKSLWSGSLVIINAISLVFVTPFVAFYLLRDWDKMVATVDSMVPLSHRQEVRELATSVDDTLAGFLRGQSLVIMCMTVFYCSGLGLLGLDFWLLVGLITGVMSFVPFVGAIVGFVLSVGLALFQFDSFAPVIGTMAVFMLGQFIEGNILTPRLVGGRVGLHPAWVMFALLAGGSLFGFMGILVAVPVAAIIGVVIRFGIRKYRISQFYGQMNEVGVEGIDGDLVEYLGEDMLEELSEKVEIIAKTTKPVTKPAAKKTTPKKSTPKKPVAKTKKKS